MKSTKRLQTWAILVIAIANITACVGPAKVPPVEEIDTNETAFLVPLEGESKEGQDKFMSVEFLEANKVAAKRVTIPVRQRDTGRGWWKYEWLPTLRVVKVNRRPVTREWTVDEESGTAAKDQAIHVESKESIGFAVGLNLTAYVTEEDAATFLYWYAGKPLAEVVDENVRGLATSVLSREFGKRDLMQGKESKAEIFATCFEETREHFEGKGITIDNLGYAEGLKYDQQEIQDGINKRFLAEQLVETAAQEKLAQDQRNEMLVATAKANREAAEEFAKAQEAAVEKTKLEIERVRADAQFEAAKNWGGTLPASILPQGSDLLFGLDGAGTK